MKAGILAAILVLSILVTTEAGAVGINSHVALPVASEEFVLRSQVLLNRLEQDQGDTRMEITQFVFPQVLVYGATPRLMLMGALPIVVKEVESREPNGDKSSHRTAGVADLPLLLRYEIHARNWKVGTLRAAVLGGVEIPSGRNGMSSDSTDWIGGAIYSIQAMGKGLDADILYKFNSAAGGVKPGNVLSLDVAGTVMLYPFLRYTDSIVNHQINLVLEFNGQAAQHSRDGGEVIDGSGGNLLQFTPGLQWAGRRTIFEAGLQIPVVKDLNGLQPEPSTGAILSARFAL